MKAYDVLSDLETRKKYDSSLRKNNTNFGSSSNNRGTTSQTTGKSPSYYQYTSYAKTREESEFDFDHFMKDILRKYRKNQNYSQKEEFIHGDNLNINLDTYYEILNHSRRNQEWDQKEDNITLKKTLRK